MYRRGFVGVSQFYTCMYMVLLGVFSVKNIQFSVVESVSRSSGTNLLPPYMYLYPSVVRGGVGGSKVSGADLQK